jgi:PAS domain S-box-containing protein
MSLKGKFIAFTAAFLAMVIIMGSGAFYLFNVLGDNLDTLNAQVQRHKAHADLRSAILEFIHATNGWALTGDEHYRTLYNESVSEVNKSFGKLSELTLDQDTVQEIGMEFQEAKRHARTIIETDRPVGDLKVLRALNLLGEQEELLHESINGLSDRSLKTTVAVLAMGESIKNSLTVYLIALIVFSIAISTFLMVLMRKTFEEPYKELLHATEKVAGGDLSYRIHSKSRDEFGLISNRFDDMVESLDSSDVLARKKLRETELLLEVARIAGQTPDLKEALRKIVGSVADKMRKDVCAVYLRNTELKVFLLESSSTSDIIVNTSLPLDSEVPKKVLEEGGPVIVEDTDEFEGGRFVCDNCGSLLAVPVQRDQDCIGILLLGNRRPRGIADHEIHTAVIIAHTIATTVRNAELYAATNKQLKQLSIVYELSRALTSVYNPEELLETVSSEIAKLINAKGCVIRLLEDNYLKVKSYYGPMEEAIEAVPVGSGIAGWVVKEGKSLFIEDISQMPEEIRGKSMLVGKSAISVPLKVGERIIGTLGLYDKLDEGGNAIPFSLEDFQVAKGFASISAVAIEKARMQEQERKREAEALEAKKRLDLLFESVQGGIITLDREYKVTAANNYVQMWVDTPLKEIIGKNALDVFHEKGGICPHCAARATIETGDTNSITQSSGLNYAELSSYPLKDEAGNVIEAVVFIQDITDRVLYQEEIMGLYREVMQTKEYMEGLINNSADAIVTSGIDGVVKSWNPAAEQIYGYTADEVMGKFLPFVPPSLLDFENENRDKISRGEVLKLETIRKRKDGKLIEVSLTLSPIKDVTGDIIGISGISRDISDKKRVEKELIRRNQELSRMFFISSAMRGTLDLDKLQRMVLTAVTMSDGLGFNRAIIFQIDEESQSLRGSMGVGPATAEEAWQIWENLSMDRKTLREIMIDIESGPMRKDSFLDRLSLGIEVPLEADTILTRAVKTKRTYNVANVKEEPLSDSVIIQQLGTEAYAVVPLIVRNKVIGVLWVDNLYNRKPITDEDMKFLAGFADQVASAVEAARLFEQVSLAEAELENIFRSISDMVFFTDRDYTIRKVNQAVVNKVGISQENVVGRKCYEVFHGMDKPWPACPHHMTVEDMSAHVEELEDPHLKGTYLTSTSPIFDMEGVFLGTVHVVRDITELKELQNKLQSSERMAALGEVAAKVAHEIRNPLVSVGGFAKRLENKLEGSNKEYAHIIAREVSRLEEILKDILGFVKEVRMSKKSVPLNDIIGEVLSLLKSEFKDRGNALVEELDGSGLELTVDPNRIKEALLNVVSNANQATDGGTISVKTYPENGEAVVEVSDTGCGIREEDMARIFDPFFTTRPTGTGLGLAIAKRIIEEHDGEITVTSNYPGGGSTFKIALPVKEG